MWLTSEELLADWIGDDVPTAPEETIQRWIDKAERFVLFEVPGLEARLANDTEPHLLDTVKDVVSAVVMRVLRNPQGMRSQQRTAGAYSEMVTFGGDQPGVLMLTDKERAMLAEPGSGTGKAYSVGLNSNEYGAHLPWCSWNIGGIRCSCGAVIAGEPIYEVIPNDR